MVTPAPVANRGGRSRVLRRFWTALGPGVITGAADDDPSGIATYSIAGAHFGLAFLWTALLTWPLMAAVQAMCARIGMVAGRGLVGTLRKRVPRPILIVASVALLVANTINVAADLSGMADAAEMLTRINSHLWVVLFGVAIAWVRALGEFGIVLITAYFPQGIPVKLWVNLQDIGLDAIYALLWLFFLVAIPLPLIFGVISRRAVARTEGV